MNQDKQFSLENLMVSLIGHLILIAIMVTSFAVLVNRAMLVAPDRIQIMEIDLNSVKVSGDETKLYNTNPIEDKTPDVKPEQTSEPEPAPAPDAPEKEIETPSLVDPEPEAKPDKKAEPTPEPDKVEPMPAAPKKKMVIRVNRESVSLNRTLNVSVVDALRVAMTRCWVIDKNRPDISDIRAVAHLTMRKNGTVRDVWFESAARAETDPAFAYVLDTIRAAINTCQPLRMLPENEFEKWEKIQLTFYPTSGKVM
ncbi:MAG: hypothetical protein J6Y49_01520 [Alphaproteobacteria bacterium]|nr:hypothetical protein [Alphaproteobacteria bacterium]